MRKADIYGLLGYLFLSIIAMSCNTLGDSKSNMEEKKQLLLEILVEAESFNESNDQLKSIEYQDDITYVQANSDGWITLDVNVSIPGRYTVHVHTSSNESKDVIFWLEDYHDNKDGRTYNITGNIYTTGSYNGFNTYSVDGTPLNSGLHRMKLHLEKGSKVDWIRFNLLKTHKITPTTLTQNTKGSSWEIVWSDEFDTENVDTTKWTYDVGDWGWGNNELQYYTEGREENARIEDGNLIIEARKGDLGNEWTSARLTTRGKTSFLYGRIEFRAKVPSYKGNWAAGWTLGDEYVDELSWPYCGEIDILESVGFEMDDETGNGIAHASTHCGAYYFKLGNQPTGIIEVENMNNSYHIYAVEWLPTGIHEYVDDRLYASYNDTSTDLSWPFSKPQNIILNLAMGGGWGGEHGIDESVSSQKMIIDYVRVYELR